MQIPYDRELVITRTHMEVFSFFATRSENLFNQDLVFMKRTNEILRTKIDASLKLMNYTDRQVNYLLDGFYGELRLLTDILCMDFAIFTMVQGYTHPTPEEIQAMISEQFVHNLLFNHLHVPLEGWSNQYRFNQWYAEETLLSRMI